MAREPEPIRIGGGIDSAGILIATVCGIVLGVTLWIACGGLS